MDSRELYAVLGLQPFADGAMVDQAYWHLAKSFQTLAVTDPRARQALDELNEAYGVLGTPRLRDEYDQTLVGRSSRTDVLSETVDEPPRKGITSGGSRFRSFFRRKSAATAAINAMPEISQKITHKPTTTPEVVRRTPRSSAAGVQELQASTGAMLKRWRANAGIETHPHRPDGAAGLDTSPVDTTLVDIFRSEQAVGDVQDPLNAVMDVLRSSKEGAPAAP